MYAWRDGIHGAWEQPWRSLLFIDSLLPSSTRVSHSFLRDISEHAPNCLPLGRELRLYSWVSLTFRSASTQTQNTSPLMHSASYLIIAFSLWYDHSLKSKFRPLPLKLNWLQGYAKWRVNITSDPFRAIVVDLECRALLILFCFCT